MNPFECIKPNPYPMNNKSGYIGYGCLTNKRTKANIVSKRKCSRYIRKYGFDITETWSLDYAIASWLSDNVGGFFRKCGSFDDWSDYDMNGVPYNEANPKLIIEADEVRHDYFLKKLEDFLRGDNEELVHKFNNFLLPRLSYLTDHTCGYPSDFNSFEEWQDYLNQMIDEMARNRYSEKFINHFFSLWD